MSRKEISTDSCSIIWLCYLTCDVWRENTSSNSTPCSQHYVQEEDETVSNLRRRENCNVMDSSFLWGQTVRRNLCSTPRTNHLTHNTVVVITCIYKASTISSGTESEELAENSGCGPGHPEKWDFLTSFCFGDVKIIVTSSQDTHNTHIKKTLLHTIF